MKKQVMMVALFTLVAILFTGFAFAAQNCRHHVFENFEITCNPTCTEGGSKTARCSNPGCTAECVRSIRALGHEFTEFVDNGDGTETAICNHEGCTATFTRVR